jgi:hypothetical protein
MLRPKRRWIPLAPLTLAALTTLAGCADLEVTNLTAPDADRVFEDADDVEALIAGGFNTWHYQKYSYTACGMFLSIQSFQHSAPWAGFGMEYYGRIPRQPVGNFQAHPEYYNISRAWNQTYSALASVAMAFRALDGNPEMVTDFEPDDLVRIRALGRFVQGLGHGTLALLYARGFVVDETTDLEREQTPVDYHAMMEAAYGYLDRAIALADGADFEIPARWMSVPVTADQLVRIAHSFKARFRANLARTPSERAAVDWDAVIADVDAGVQDDWIMDMDIDAGWWASGLYYGNNAGWSEMNMFINGMADQSGNYQRWLQMPLSRDRVPAPPGEDPIIIVTPDERFPAGTTVEEQMARPGRHYVIPCVDDGPDGPNPPECALTDFAVGNLWARPDRGTWRWSYYMSIEASGYTALTDTEWPEIDYDEMRLLEAEGLLRTGRAAEAATLINISRTAAGLSATDADGTNTSCVPKLPMAFAGADVAPGNPGCGGLLEMLKWEKRQEVRFKGPFMASWFFDGRGWSDLYEGTPLHLPIPCEDVQVLQLDGGCRSFGGDPDAPGSAPGSIYEIEAT